MAREDPDLINFLQFTEAQLKAIIADTRLPGEIAHTYGLTAKTIVRLKQKAAMQHKLRDKRMP